MMPATMPPAEAELRHHRQPPQHLGHDRLEGDGSNDSLNVAVADIDESTGAPAGITYKVTLSDTSPLRPALAGLNGYLLIGRKGALGMCWPVVNAMLSDLAATAPNRPQ